MTIKLKSRLMFIYNSLFYNNNFNVVINSFFNCELFIYRECESSCELIVYLDGIYNFPDKVHVDNLIQ